MLGLKLSDALGVDGLKLIEPLKLCESDWEGVDGEREID